jgi:hypothetical protein
MEFALVGISLKMQTEVMLIDSANHFYRYG